MYNVGGRKSEVETTEIPNNTASAAAVLCRAPSIKHLPQTDPIVTRARERESVIRSAKQSRDAALGVQVAPYRQHSGTVLSRKAGAGVWGGGVQHKSRV